MPDPIYNSVAVTKFINGLMWEGKKSVAEQIFYSAMVKLGEKAQDEPLKVFKAALDSVAPTLSVGKSAANGFTYRPRQVTIVHVNVEHAAGRAELGWPPVSKERELKMDKGRKISQKVVIVGGESKGNVTGGLGRSLRAPLFSIFVRQRMTMLVSKEHHADLESLTELIEAGSVTPSVDRTYLLAPRRWNVAYSVGSGTPLKSVSSDSIMLLIPSSPARRDSMATRAAAPWRFRSSVDRQRAAIPA